MIKAISPYWGELLLNTNVNFSPPVVLDILAREAFIKNMKGPAVDSLRRCLKALDAGKIYRKTVEYDNLIEL
jgi:hypothetical protein